MSTTLDTASPQGAALVECQDNRVARASLRAWLAISPSRRIPDRNSFTSLAGCDAQF
jgi:hypothetical protein